MKTTFIITVLCFAALFIQAESGPAQCYFCAVQCSSPLEVQDCPTTEGEDSLCVSMSASNPDSDSPSIYKACGPNTDDFKASCDELDQVEGSSCYTCDTDLCNRD